MRFEDSNGANQDRPEDVDVWKKFLVGMYECGGQLIIEMTTQRRLIPAATPTMQFGALTYLKNGIKVQVIIEVIQGMF